MMGVDFNDGFLAVANVGADGNCARRDLHRFDVGSYGGADEQRRDAMAKAVLEGLPFGFGQWAAHRDSKARFQTQEG